MTPDDAFSGMEKVDGGFDRLEGNDKTDGGWLVPLKTTLETRKRDKVVEVYVLLVPVKEASGTLSLIRKLVPDDGGLDFQHLRRFAKLTEVPEHVRNSIAAIGQAVLSPSEGAPSGLLLIVGPVSAVSLMDVKTATGSEVSMFKVKVPLLAPTSLEQAKAWTAQYWPTVYKKSNPFGPHPSIVSRAEDEIRDEVGKWMDLAHDVGREASDRGYGEKIGVVVVERKAGTAKVVAVAGDARWKGCGMQNSGEGAGNVPAHAAMRVIGLVAGALRSRDEELRNSSQISVDSNGVEGTEIRISKTSTISAVQNGDSNSVSERQKNATRSNELRNPVTSHFDMMSVSGVSSHAETDAMHEDSTVSASDWSWFTPPSGINDRDIFLDRPWLELEKKHFDPDGNQNGYLCHNLEIYCTHEPCVMCSMAIVHSRFGKVVLQERMKRTGGMYADGELGHGLAWRKELNWTLLAWQWRTSSSTEGHGGGGVELHA